MTEAQIKWAEQHDWFVSRDGDNIVVADRYSDGTEIIMLWLGTFRELRDWGGY